MRTVESKRAKLASNALEPLKGFLIAQNMSAEPLGCFKPLLTSFNIS